MARGGMMMSDQSRSKYIFTVICVGILGMFGPSSYLLEYLLCGGRCLHIY
jgi:hypothetical protein